MGSEMCIRDSAIVACYFVAFNQHKKIIWSFAKEIEKNVALSVVVQSAKEIPFTKVSRMDGFYLQEEKELVHELVSIGSDLPLWSVHCSIYSNGKGYTTGHYGCSALNRW